MVRTPVRTEIGVSLRCVLACLFSMYLGRPASGPLFEGGLGTCC